MHASRCYSWWDNAQPAFSISSTFQFILLARNFPPFPFCHDSLDDAAIACQILQGKAQSLDSDELDSDDLLKVTIALYSTKAQVNETAKVALQLQ